MLSNKFSQYVNFIHKQTGGTSPFGIYVYIYSNRISNELNDGNNTPKETYKEFANEDDMKNHMIEKSVDVNNVIFRNDGTFWDIRGVGRGGNKIFGIYIKGIFDDTINTKYFSYIQEAFKLVTQHEFELLPNSIIYDIDLSEFINPTKPIESPKLIQHLGILFLKKQIIKSNSYKCPITNDIYEIHPYIHNSYILTSNKNKAFCFKTQ